MVGLADILGTMNLIDLMALTEADFMSPLGPIPQEVVDAPGGPTGQSMFGLSAVGQWNALERAFFVGGEALRRLYTDDALERAFPAAAAAGLPFMAPALHRRCIVCGGSGVRCCEFGRDR